MFNCEISVCFGKICLNFISDKNNVVFFVKRCDMLYKLFWRNNKVVFFLYRFYYDICDCFWCDWCDEEIIECLDDYVIVVFIIYVGWFLIIIGEWCLINFWCKRFEVEFIRFYFVCYVYCYICVFMKFVCKWDNFLVFCIFFGNFYSVFDCFCFWV